MENNQFPRPEEEQALDAMPILPDSVDLPPEDEVPVITELTMQVLPSEVVAQEESSEDMPSDDALPQEPISEEVTEESPDSEEPADAEEAASAEVMIPGAEEPPVRDSSSFMSRIPDVEEDYPDDSPADPEIIETVEALEALIDKPVDQEYRNTDTDPDFDSMFHAPAPEEAKQDRERPTHKGRPKRKRGEGLLGIPNIIATFVWLALILVIGVTAGRMLWVCAADVLAFGREDKAVTITIYDADTMEDIVDKLHSNGLIRYKSLFNLYASISDAEEDIKPGIYDLNTRYDYHALVNFMSPSSSRQVVELTIPEGYTCQQIFNLLEENRVCTALDIAAYAANGELNDYWFLEGVERGAENCLEGYLFPDTYEFYKNSTPREALQRMLNNFEVKFNDDMRAQLDTLNSKLTGDYTVREITIVASLIEKESAAPSESPKVAGVIYNRLFNWGSNPKLLGIDAAIVYAQGDSEKIDTNIDHPYNTYRNPGLTPGPISNPGLASLKAALNPEMHNYYYYVLNPATGMHQFSTTNQEHNAWIAQFYN